MSRAGYQKTIEVVDPDPAWPGAFMREAESIREALGPRAKRIDHYGSTSVPGLAAKPIIDIQVALAEVDADDLERRLAPLGYARVPWPGDERNHPFFAKPAEGSRTHHLHACVAGSLEDYRHLVLRDYLCAHPAEADAYGALKRDLAERHAGDRQAYVDGKDAFVKALESRALAWGGDPGG